MNQEDVRREVDRSVANDENLNKGIPLSVPRITGWGDVMAVVTLVGLVVGGLVWGMKLEGRYDALDSRINSHRSETLALVDAIRAEVALTRVDIQEVKSMLQRGVLPVTDVRLQNLENRMNDMEREQHRRD